MYLAVTIRSVDCNSLLTHPRDDNWVTIAAPIPLVPPVTRAFLESKRQKLAGGGAGTEKSELDACANDRMVSPCNKKKMTENIVLLYIGQTTLARVNYFHF